MVQGLVALMRVLTLAHSSVRAHCGDHCVNLSLSVLPAQKVAVRFANQSSVNLQHEHRCLDYPGHPDHIHRLDLVDGLLQHLAFFKEHCVGVGPDLAQLDLSQLLVSDLAGLVHLNFFNHFVQMVVKIVGGVNLHLRVLHELFKFAVAVCCQKLDLSTFPVVLKGKNRLKDTPLLLDCELTVLAHRVETHNELFLGRQERRALNLWPLSDLGLEGLPCCVGRVLLGKLLRLELFHLVLLGLSLLLHILEVGNSGRQGFVRETGVVNDRDRHVGSKSGHGFEPHIGFAHHLRDVDMFEAV